MKIWIQGLASPKKWPFNFKLMVDYAHSVADPGTTVEFYGVETGGIGDQYRFIEYLDTRGLLDNALKAERGGYDAFVIINTLDAGLHQAREAVNIPVLGILQTALLISSTMGRNFSLVAPNKKFVPRWEELVAGYGFGDRMVSIEYMEFTPPELDRQHSEPAYRDRMVSQFNTAANLAINKGAEVVIPVGGSVILFLARNNVRTVNDVPILDGIAYVIKMAELMVKVRKATGVFISRKLTYASPPPELMKQVVADYGMLK